MEVTVAHDHETLVAQYQELKKQRADAEARVIRARAMLEAAEAEARDAALAARELGFGSLAEVEERRQALLAEAEKAIAKVREVVA
jgi:3-methyladenine DNA glycosylase Tag